MLRPIGIALALALAVGATGPFGSADAARERDPAGAADRALDRALDRFVDVQGGPPAVVAVVQRPGADATLHAAGIADLANDDPPTIDDHMRLASVAKAFSGAAALSVVADGMLSLTDTLGARVSGLPAAWADVTLAQLLQHTSGLPDFSDSKEFRDALRASLLTPPPPATLLSYVAGEPLLFEPGTKYHYSNSDNIAVGLMVEAATGRSYEQNLEDRVFAPLGLTSTSLPGDAALPEPALHGYDVSSPADPEDVSVALAAGWTWASGGIVASPADANRFVRGYAAGTTTNPPTRKEQRSFLPGSSEPPGPGTNAAGLAIFRYSTKCGTVYGHTGNTAGYTQFVGATKDGSRSATVSISAQITPKSNTKRFGELRRIFGLAVCAALAKSA
ncbi:MAG TPA: serine hydrolase domain-containing protein [Acidimicrobiia bacterium]